MSFRAAVEVPVVKWIYAGMLCLAVAIAASGVAFTSIAPSAIAAAQVVFWSAAVACVALVVMAVVTGIRRRGARDGTQKPHPPRRIQ